MAQLAADLPIPSGATLPSSPLANQFFMHTPTGRRVLMVYTNSAWYPVESYGSMTIYVNGASGTDSADKGTGTGSDAFATVQYAIDSIPALVGGNVVINIAAGTYAETVNIYGKTYTGAYSITINGTLTSVESFSSATVAAGSGATQGTVTKTGQFTADSHANLLVYFATDNTFRVIDSHTNDALTLVGTAPSSTTQTCEIFTWGTSITQVNVLNGQSGITINYVKFATAFPTIEPAIVKSMYETAPEYSIEFVYVCKENSFLRGGPDSFYKIIRPLSLGESYRVHERRGEWVMIEKVGWVELEKVCKQ